MAAACHVTSLKVKLAHFVIASMPLFGYKLGAFKTTRSLFKEMGDATQCRSVVVVVVVVDMTLMNQLTEAHCYADEKMQKKVSKMQKMAERKEFE